MTNYKLIAITGGIGSGKSFALKAIARAGYTTLSSDQIVSELYKKRGVKKKIKKLFPDCVNGRFNLQIDRKKLSDRVFNSQEDRVALQDAVTPLVLDKILSEHKKNKGHIFAEVPLLFECSYQKYFDGVIVLLRDQKDRIESVKRRSLSEEQILLRIKSQVDYDKMDLSPYTVIINKGDAEFEKELLKSIENMLK